MNPNLHRVIGVDLGTTYSVVAAWNHHTLQAEVIQDQSYLDDPTTPSVIGLHPHLKKVWCGWDAKRNLPNDDPRNTIIEIKREMGELFRYDTLSKFGGGGKVGEPVKVSFAGGVFLPQEISAFTLMKMKEIAEDEIGEEIRDAVITVPAYFKEIQRKATEEAALLAGLYPRLLIAEPTAAAICYGVDQQESERKRYVVYDLGGGTFDVSIIEVLGQEITVLATSGNSRLGGGDFDDQIVLWAIEQLKMQYQLDYSTNPMVRAQIKFIAELAKRNLSKAASTTLNLQQLNAQKAPTLTLTREVFLQRIEPFLKKSIDYVNEALQLAKGKGVEREDIDAVLLVGGSSKIPKVKELLLDTFNKDESFVRSELDPDLVVARGAAVMARNFAPTAPPFEISTFLDQRKKSEALKVSTDVSDKIEVGLITEHSLGLLTENDRGEVKVDKIVPRGENIPTEKTRGGYVNGGMTEYIPVHVFQGESEKPLENTQIGTVQIGPMEPKPAGEHRFEVTYALDDNGLLTVTIHHINEGKKYQGQFQSQTAVGGDQLAIRRETLKNMYGIKMPQIKKGPVMAPPQPVAPVGQPVSVAQPAAVGSTTRSDGAHRAMPQPIVPQVTVPSVMETVGIAPNLDQQSSAPMPTQKADNINGGVILPEPKGEVPVRFARVVTRTKRYFLTKSDQDLYDAYADFISAVNDGQPEAKLEIYAQDLDDAFKKAP